MKDFEIQGKSLTTLCLGNRAGVREREGTFFPFLPRTQYGFRTAKTEGSTIHVHLKNHVGFLFGNLKETAPQARNQPWVISLFFKAKLFSTVCMYTHIHTYTCIFVCVYIWVSWCPSPSRCQSGGQG